jgi:HEPN domain-containing protein
MAKSDREHALQVLAMAKKDHQALTHMLDAESFSEEIFGFHAQQAIEKTLKAWIAGRGLEYPKSHDVSALVMILEDQGEDLSKFSNLEDYTIFAVQYRYEAYDESEERLDRREVIAVTGSLLTHVEGILNAAP